MRCTSLTRALSVKRYHEEVGTDVVDAVFDDESAVNAISDISVIELYSAFAKKIRVGEITEEDFRATTKALAADIQSGAIQLEVPPINSWGKPTSAQSP